MTTNNNKFPTTTIIEDGKEITIIDYKQLGFNAYDGIEDKCCLCGKKATNKTRGYDHYVHMSINGYLVPTDHEANSQGFMIVGPECQRRMPKEFTTKF